MMLTRDIFIAMVIAMVMAAATTLVPPPARAIQNDYEIDLRELRGIRKAEPVKPPQPKRTHAATESARTATSQQESSHVVRAGENIYQVLMKQYGLSDPAAERLIPEVMRLNGITSPHALKVGQHLRIPLPARVARQSVSHASPAPEPGVVTPATGTNGVQGASGTSSAPSAGPATITIGSAPPCQLARDMVQKMGLLATTPTGMAGVEVSASYAGRSVTVACGLSRATQYTYERLLAGAGSQLLVFEEGERAERVVEKLANYLGLLYQKCDIDSNAPARYLFAPFGARSRELELTILPPQAPPAPPVTN